MISSHGKISDKIICKEYYQYALLTLQNMRQNDMQRILSICRAHIAKYETKYYAKNIINMPCSHFRIWDKMICKEYYQYAVLTLQNIRQNDMQSLLSICKVWDKIICKEYYQYAVLTLQNMSQNNMQRILSICRAHISELNPNGFLLQNCCGSCKHTCSEMPTIALCFLKTSFNQ